MVHGMVNIGGTITCTHIFTGHRHKRTNNGRVVGHSTPVFARYRTTQSLYKSDERKENNLSSRYQEAHTKKYSDPD